MLKSKENPYLANNKKRCFSLKQRLKLEDTLWKYLWTRNLSFYKKKSIYTLQILKESKVLCLDWLSQKVNKLMNLDVIKRNQEKLKHFWVKLKKFNQVQWLLLMQIKLNQCLVQENQWKELQWCLEVEVLPDHQIQVLLWNFYFLVSKQLQREE